MKKIGVKIVSLALAVVVLLGCTALAGAKEEGKAYEVGQVIEFGSYPQSQVTDEATIQALDAIEADIHIYKGYYEAVYRNSFGDKDFKENTDMMSYKDVEYNGAKYRGVKINSYRPWDATYISDEKFSYQDEHGYTSSRSTYYWFKYEPLKWKIFDIEKGLAICEKVIDAQPINSTFTYGMDGYTNFGTTVQYSNDFCASQLCEWLNDHFLNTAFTAEEQEKIPETTVDTGFEDGSCGSNRGAATTQKVVLLTYNQALGNKVESEYGNEIYVKDVFNFPYENSTDYAKSQGGYQISSWWLVTPKLGDTISIKYVSPMSYEEKSLIADKAVYSTGCGVRPVISFGEFDAAAGEDGENGTIKLGTVIAIAGAAVGVVAAGVATTVILKKKKAVK